MTWSNQEALRSNETVSRGKVWSYMCDPRNDRKDAKFLNAPTMRLYFADFALQLLDYFFSFQWFNLHSVEFAGRSKLQLHRIFHSLDQTVFSTFAGRHEFLGVNDFSRHVFTTFSAILVTMHVIICFGGRKQTVLSENRVTLCLWGIFLMELNSLALHEASCSCSSGWSSSAD